MNEPASPYSGKRVLDLALLVLTLPLLLPLLAATALAVRISLGKPAIFAQLRPGRHGKPFYLMKFRSMTQDRDAQGCLLPDDVRLTKFGRRLRASSLDELPELFNVLKGEMSFVGPRPLLMQYLDHYSPEQSRRHDVLPGITGWAQVNGRNSISWEDKFRLDVWYIDHCSIWLDLKILALTAVCLFSRSGINAPGSSTMPQFAPASKSSNEPKQP